MYALLGALCMAITILQVDSLLLTQKIDKNSEYIENFIKYSAIFKQLILIERYIRKPYCSKARRELMDRIEKLSLGKWCVHHPLRIWVEDAEIMKEVCRLSVTKRGEFLATVVVSDPPELLLGDPRFRSYISEQTEASTRSGLKIQKIYLMERREHFDDPGVQNHFKELASNKIEVNYIIISEQSK